MPRASCRIAPACRPERRRATSSASRALPHEPTAASFRWRGVLALPAFGKGVAPGVFCVVEPDLSARASRGLTDLHIGEGPFFTLHRPYHLTSLETPRRPPARFSTAAPTCKPLRRAGRRDRRRSPSAISPRAPCSGRTRRDGLQGVVDDVERARSAKAPPIGLAERSRVTRPIRKGEMLTYEAARSTRRSPSRACVASSTARTRGPSRRAPRKPSITLIADRLLGQDVENLGPASPAGRAGSFPFASATRSRSAMPASASAFIFMRRAAIEACRSAQPSSSRPSHGERYGIHAGQGHLVKGRASLLASRPFHGPNVALTVPSIFAFPKIAKLLQLLFYRIVFTRQPVPASLENALERQRVGTGCSPR